MTASWFWVFVFGFSWYAIYTTFKRSLPAAMFLVLVLWLNFYFDLLPAYVMWFIYLFLALTLFTNIVFTLMNKRNFT